MTLGAYQVGKTSILLAYSHGGRRRKKDWCSCRNRDVLATSACFVTRRREKALTNVEHIIQVVQAN